MIPKLTKDEVKVRIAKRIAKDFSSSSQAFFLNLGVGIPTMVADYIDNDNVFIQAENGMLGIGPTPEEGQADDQLINAGRQLVSETKGCSYFDSSMSFGMIRGGHIDATVIGAFEVDQNGNIANWIIPNGKQLGVGGAMDLVTGAKKVVIAMQHTNKKGKSKIVKQCQLPITGFGEADLIVTEFAYFSFENDKLILHELAPEVTLEDISSITEAQFEVSPSLKSMEI